MLTFSYLQHAHVKAQHRVITIKSCLNHQTSITGTKYLWQRICPGQKKTRDYLRLSGQFVFWFLSVHSLQLPQLAMEKADASHLQEITVEMFRIQEQLARLHTRLEDRHQTKEQAEAKNRQAQDHLEAMRSHYSSTTSQASNVKANGETDWPFGGLA